MVKKRLFILLCVIAFATSGCGNGPSVEEQITPPVDPEPIVIDDPPHTPEPAAAPLPLAKEISRDAEEKEYDYTRWINGMADIDIGLLVGEDWIYDSMAVVGGTQWSDPQNVDAKFTYKQVATDVFSNTPPKDAIWEHYRSIIEKGGNIEYGVYNSKYLTEAYYVRYVENGYVYIALYFAFYPQEVYDKQLINGAGTASALLYENKIGSEDSEGGITEDAFWQAAQSIFRAKDYDEDNTDSQYRPPYIPYIPEVDGLNI